jgi:hypothetical protein
MQHVGRGHAHGIERHRRERIARAIAIAMIGDAPAGGVELDAGADACAGADLPMQLGRNLLAVEDIDGERRAVVGFREAQPREALAAFDHRPQRERLEAVEVGEARGVGAVGPAVPERVQPIAHGGIGMHRARLDAGADRVRNEALDGGRDPRVVARVPAGAPRGHGRAGEDRGVQCLDALRTLPAPAAAGCIKGAAAGKAEHTANGRPHAPCSRPILISGTIPNVQETFVLFRQPDYRL